MFGGNPAGRHLPHPAVKRAEEAAKKAVTPPEKDFFSEASMQAAWDAAEAQMRAEGIDVDKLLEQAGKALPEVLPGDERGGVK